MKEAVELTTDFVAMTAEAEVVTLYWRPGCFYCARLRRGLRRAGVTVLEVNIWQDPSAALVVRSLANGNETVPTVTFGATTLVNPSVRQVLATINRKFPDERH